MPSKALYAVLPAKGGGGVDFSRLVLSPIRTGGLHTRGEVIFAGGPSGAGGIAGNPMTRHSPAPAKLAKSRRVVEAMMREVHENEPSTVTRAKRFGPGGKPAMLKAIALSKARKAGARVPKKKGY